MYIIKRINKSLCASANGKIIPRQTPSNHHPHWLKIHENPTLRGKPNAMKLPLRKMAIAPFIVVLEDIEMSFLSVFTTYFQSKPRFKGLLTAISAGSVGACAVAATAQATRDAAQQRRSAAAAAATALVQRRCPAPAAPVPVPGRAPVEPPNSDWVGGLMRSGFEDFDCFECVLIVVLFFCVFLISLLMLGMFFSNRCAQ